MNKNVTEAGKSVVSYGTFLYAEKKRGNTEKKKFNYGGIYDGICDCTDIGCFDECSGSF